ncbi:uncharacterized protein LOC100901357 [Galendromus occidentalis]|uniref:Uncharacterized protein LOC100901357 n=1 Tax=Galendromus occidentalis TaxID=34638 RepID=A0AAJ6QTR6_9ACAR|nr:uncharacterized protein LOC100901357 [Galendromus occidentalis]
MKGYYTACVTLLVTLCVANVVEGHGRLTEPPGRSTAWRFGFKTPPNYNDNELFCGGLGRQHKINGGRCGVCGDPWDVPTPRANEDGGRYGRGVIVRKYYQGETIDVSVDITANHNGRFWFRLCPADGEVNQECFDRHVLHIEGSGDSWELVNNATGLYKFRVRLPENVTCERCVLQWDWTAGNQWNICPDGRGRRGCGPQETFRGCADISIA